MKRLVGSILVIVGFLVFAAFSYYSGNTDANSADSSSEPAVQEEQKIKIGLIQFIAHESLDTISQGAIEALEEAGYVDGENVEIDYQNGQGDQSNLSSIATQFINDDVDLIIAVATPAAQAVANATSDIPIILAGITDPEGAGLVESNDQPGNNVTGVSDMSPVDEQLALIRQLHPDAKKLGIMYASSELNAKVQGDMAEELASDYGFEAVVQTVNTTNDVNQASTQLASEADVIWVPNDNIVAAAFPTLIENTNAAGVAVYPAVDIMVAQGGVATMGINQYFLGFQSGQMAADILQNGTDPAQTPIQLAENLDLVINYEQADRLGVTITDEMKEEAVDAASLEVEGE